MLLVIGKDLQVQFLDKCPMNKFIISTSVHLRHTDPQGEKNLKDENEDSNRLQVKESVGCPNLRPKYLKLQHLERLE